MNILAERDPGARVVRLQMVFVAGSLTDPTGPEDRAGRAHLAARAMLRGTRHMTESQLTLAIERLGASISVAVDQDLVMFQASVLLGQWEPFLDLFAQVLAEPAFAPDQISILKEVISGEWRTALQDPREVASRAALGLLYPGTPAARVPQGTLEGIAALAESDLQRFFEDHLNSCQVLAGVVSPWDTHVIERQLLQKFGRWASGARGGAAIGSPTWIPKERTGLVVEQEDMGTTPIYVMLPGYVDSDSDLPALEVANFAFGEDFTSRLMQVLRVEKGWTYGVSSGFAQLVPGRIWPGIFSAYLFPAAEHAAAAIRTTVQLFEQYAARGLSAEEFEQARQSLVCAAPFRAATAEQRLGLRMRQQLTGRPAESVQEYVARIERLTLDELNATITRRTEIDALSIVAVGDPQSLRPALIDVGCEIQGG